MISCKRFALFSILALCFAIIPGCGDDDDDDSADTADDDTNGDDIDDDSDDDSADANDDIDDDADDDLNDDTSDDDVDDDVDDDADDDTPECVDEDGDTYGDNCLMGPDCDDTNPLINPGAAELPDDGIDQNCDDIDLLLGDDTGVFVATTGDDANPGTMAAPKLTINAGVSLALQAGKSVFIAEGDYTQDVVTEVSLFGGYESVGWTRDMDVNVTTINAETDTAVTVGESLWRDDNMDGDWDEARLNESNPIAIQGFTINGGSGDSYSSGVFNTRTATLANNIIHGGSGNWNCGVSNSGTATLTSNVIHGGSESNHSYGVYNGEGTATLIGNDIDGGSGNNSCGVSITNTNDYEVTVMLMDNTINGGSGILRSIGVENIGIATLLANDIDGGTGGGSSCGVQNYRLRFFLGVAILIDNIIGGGSGSENSTGVNNLGDATLENNIVDGGAESNISTGVWSDGWLTMLNNFVSGGTGNQESYAVTYVEYVYPKLANKVIGGGYNAQQGDVKYSRDAVVPTTLINNIIDGGSSENSIALQVFIIYGANMAMLLLNNDIIGENIDCIISEYDFIGSSSECVANSLPEVNDCMWFSCDEASSNISADPLFVDPASDDFHIQSSSPCIDTGIDPTLYIIHCPEFPEIEFPEMGFDFDGDARPYGAGWDIGPDEWKP